eukprot:1547194-Prymnesium_polylepis.1
MIEVCAAPFPGERGHNKVHAYNAQRAPAYGYGYARISVKYAGSEGTHRPIAIGAEALSSELTAVRAKTRDCPVRYSALFLYRATTLRAHLDHQSTASRT